MDIQREDIVRIADRIIETLGVGDRYGGAAKVAALVAAIVRIELAGPQYQPNMSLGWMAIENEPGLVRGEDFDRHHSIGWPR